MDGTAVPPAATKTLPPARRARAWSLTLGVIIFVCGMFVGGAVTGRFLWARVVEGIQHPEVVPPILADRLERRLSLTAEQHDKVLAALSKCQKDLQAVRLANLPRIEAILEEARAAIEKPLTPEQAVKWSAEYKRLREKFTPRPAP
jgi:hypothetical protein